MICVWQWLVSCPLILQRLWQRLETVGQPVDALAIPSSFVLLWFTGVSPYYPLLFYVTLCLFLLRCVSLSVTLCLSVLLCASMLLSVSLCCHLPLSVTRCLSLFYPVPLSLSPCASLCYPVSLSVSLCYPVPIWSCFVCNGSHGSSAIAEQQPCSARVACDKDARRWRMESSYVGRADWWRHTRPPTRQSVPAPVAETIACVSILAPAPRHMRRLTAAPSAWEVVRILTLAMHRTRLSRAWELIEDFIGVFRKHGFVVDYWISRFDWTFCECLTTRMMMHAFKDVIWVSFYGAFKCLLVVEFQE